MSLAGQSNCGLKPAGHRSENGSSISQTGKDEMENLGEGGERDRHGLQGMPKALMPESAMKSLLAADAPGNLMQ